MAGAETSPRLEIVCPAAIRDAGVWPDEAERIGFDGELTVRSYHQAAKGLGDDPVLILDEAHHVKNRKVSWGGSIHTSTRSRAKVYLASGDPTPNGYYPELWGQLRMLRPDMPSYWNWIREWFEVVPTAHTRYGVSGRLLGCNPGCDPDDCEHRARFHTENLEPWMLRRPESDLELPPLVGADVPVWTPMTREQRRIYTELLEDFIADLPDGVTIEALNESSRFIALCKIATGLGTHDPDLDPTGKHSGKLALLREQLTGRTSPTLLAVYFGNTARAVARELDRMGLAYGEFGAHTTATERRRNYRAFQAGELDVLLASISVVAEGITLTTGGHVDLLERHWRPSVNRQAIKRVHRRGQSKTVSVVQYVTPDSVDVGQWEQLEGKEAEVNRLLSRSEVAAMLGQKGSRRTRLAS